MQLPAVDEPHSVRVWGGGLAGKLSATRLEAPGHVIGVMDSTGTVVNQYRYDPWGGPESVTQGVSQPLRYTAREYDAATGLYYVRHRWYMPAQGRFISEDPIGLSGGMNVFAYVGNSPTYGRDPTGVWCEVRDFGTTSETLYCEDIAPGDWATIRNYIGGAAGRRIYEIVRALGWTEWGAASCRGGFSDSQCSDIAEAHTWLTLHQNSRCRALGTQGAQRFQSGRYRRMEGGKWSDGRFAGLLGEALPVLRHSVRLSRDNWADDAPRNGLLDTVAHEEAHYRYWVQHLFSFEFLSHNDGSGDDFIYSLGQTCAAGF